MEAAPKSARLHRGGRPDPGQGRADAWIGAVRQGCDGEGGGTRTPCGIRDRQALRRSDLSWRTWRLPDRSGDTIHWLESLGVRFAEPASYFVEAYPTWHLVQPEEGPPGSGGAATMMRVLTRQAEALGVTIELGTAVTRIVRSDASVSGVSVRGPGGERDVEAGSVIVATGGFGDNPEMIAEQTGFRWGHDLYSLRVPGVVGDGLRMAWEAGAQPTEIGLELICGMPEARTLPPPLGDACRQPHLLVNRQGERFIDEGIMGNVTFTANAIARQQDRAGHLLFDSSILAAMAEDSDFRNRVLPLERIDRAAELIAGVVARGHPHFFMADTIEELAARAEIDPVGLAATVDAYNADCARGRDRGFAKDRRYLRPLTTAPFYAARHFPGAYGTLGGIKIDARTRVIDRNWRVIPGFYAAGTDACAIHGDSYVFILPGNTMGFAVNTGRIAGEQAAAYAAAAR